MHINVTKQLEILLIVICTILHSLLICIVNNKNLNKKLTYSKAIMNFVLRIYY